MINYEGKNIEEALPSMPVEILGMNGFSICRSRIYSYKNEDEAKEISEFKKIKLAKKQIFLSKDKTTLFDNIKK